MSIEIYTDGSALAKRNHPKNGFGGLGIIFIIDGEVKKTVSRGYYPTKIGRMELKAVYLALRILAKDQTATIYSDSMYVINCFKKSWLKNWERDCWPVRIKNQDILKPLLEEYRKFRPNAIRFKHVKGHNGNEYNELADEAASYRNFIDFESDLPLEVLSF